MNGGCGLRVTGLVSTLSTLKLPVSTASRAASASRLGLQIHLVELFAQMLGQARLEFLALMLHIGLDRPIFLSLKRLNFALALDNQAKRHRLHTACRFRAGQFAPQHRRQRKSDQIIERAARQIGFDQVDHPARAAWPSRRAPPALVIALKVTRSNVLW